MAEKEVGRKDRRKGYVRVVKTDLDGFYRSRPQQFRPTSAQVAMFARWMELCRLMHNELVEVVRRMRHRVQAYGLWLKAARDLLLGACQKMRLATLIALGPN